MTVSTETQTITIKSLEGVVEPGDELTFKAPSFALTEKPFKVSGTTEGVSQTVYIMLKQESWGVDWLAKDDKLVELTSDGEGKFEVEIQLENLGFNKVYAAQKKEWLGIDWAVGDIKSSTKSILTLNYVIVGGLVLGVFLVLYKKGIIQKAIGGKK